MRNQVTLERLKAVLTYDPQTGAWTWLQTLGSRGRKGSRAGCLRPDGYRSISIDGVSYLSHRLAVFYMEGQWAPFDVDHEDVTPGNDWWSNLRKATRGQNKANTKLSRANTSGYKGVYWHKKDQKWRAQLKVGGKHVPVAGAFDDPVLAHNAYLSAATAAFGEFARGGS